MYLYITLHTCRHSVIKVCMHHDSRVYSKLTLRAGCTHVLY